MLSNKSYDVAIIGGGLAGLTAAVYLAKAGKSVLVLEKTRQLGGLAQTTYENGALFNLGPRALYEGGAALRILHELDCAPRGGYGTQSQIIGLWQGKMIQLPNDLTPEENEEWNQVMASLDQVDVDAIRSISLKEWAEKHIQHERVRLFFYALGRQWTYCNDRENISAGYVIDQGILSKQGVRYVDRGWQTIVDDLHHLAEKAGATIVTGTKAEQITFHHEKVQSILLDDGQVVAISAAIIAAGPQVACQLVAGSEEMSLGKWKESSRPLYASSLDVALNRLPHPERVFSIGLDQSIYFGIHSLSVQLSDHGAHVLHVMKYKNHPDESNPSKDKQELTQALNLLQPGWDKEIVALRFLPNILVANATRTTQLHGAGPAPHPAVPEVQGLYVVGDWVGSEGRLADAAMASAKRAAEELIGIQ